MRRRLASLLALSSIVLAVPAARAQQVDPGRPDPGVAPRTGEDALLALAGPRARVRRGDDGHVRLLWGARLRPWSGDVERDAIAITQRFGDVFGIPRGADLRVERTERWHGFTIVRLRRFVGEREVIGAGVIVRSTADGAIDMVLADAGPARVESGAVIDAARAETIARAVDVGWTIARATTPVATALDVVDSIVPVWAVDLHGVALSQRMRVLIDARDGSVLAVVPLVHHATGRVYETNPTSTEGVTTDVELVDLAAGAQRLTSAYFRVGQCAAAAGGCTGTQRAAADSEGNFLYDPATRSFDDEFAEVNAFHHLSRAAAFHRERHGFTWACNGGSRMQIFVNYTESPGVAYDNAAFSPASGGQCGYLLFGQGLSGDYAYDADIVYHEYGHAVTDQVARMTGFAIDALGVSYEPLAVNEGTSDYHAGTLQGDANIAESLAGLSGIAGEGSLRVIDNDLRCPDGLFGEGHYDGRIWGGLGWSLRERLGPEAADALVFAAVASIEADPSLAIAGDLLRATAEGMVAMGTLSAADAAVVEELVEARGLPGCQRVVPLDDGRERRGWSGNEFLTASVGRGVAPVHYRIEVPVDATRLRLQVQALTLSGDDYVLHFREGGPVRVNAARVTSAASVSVAGGEVVLDATSDYALPRCKTLYIAIQSPNLRTRGQSLYRITASLEQSGDPAAECPVVVPPDAGMPVSDAGVEDDAGIGAPGGGGCGCRTSARGDERGAGLALAGLALALAVRRRRQ